MQAPRRPWCDPTRVCRSCGANGLEPVLSLGDTPLADRLLTAEQLSEPEPSAPLEVLFCASCALAQLSVSVDPDLLFGSAYAYHTSVSAGLVTHFRASAAAIVRDHQLDADDLVLEVASNDGCMLRAFLDAGIPVLGVDPAPGPAALARGAGVPTVEAYFTRDRAAEIVREQGRRASVFIANNVLAHVPDLNGFVAGVTLALADDGVAVIEVPYLVDLVERCAFDTIYHQHLCYFSVTALDALLRRHGLFINRLERIPVQGGSLRLHCSRDAYTDKVVDELLHAEVELGANGTDYLLAFASRVESLRERLDELIADVLSGGATMAGYGAAAKATTLMSYCGIGRDQLACVIDLNEHKWGRYMPGNHLAIHGPGHLQESRPDLLLLFAWNLADEIGAQQSLFRAAGGRFIIPVPEPRVV